MISQVVQLGVQWVSTRLLGTALQKTATATASTQAASLAAAYATPAALASLATSGGNAIAADAGIASTVALTRGLAAFQRGTDFVRGAGTSVSDSILARLSVGEGVVNANANRANPGIVAAMNRGERVGEERGDVNLSVRVINNSSAVIRTESVSRDEVIMIAEDVASDAVREQSPEVVANDIRSGYGAVSGALREQGNYSPRRL